MTTAAFRPSLLTRTVPTGWIAALLLGWLGLGQLLLWRFLDTLPPWAYLIGGATLIGVGVAIIRCTPARNGPSVATVAVCFLVSLILLILGGEGRFLYANIDWQVRFAVLRDLSLNPWPYVYMQRGAPDLLRAPIGMFLAPALVGKMWGERAADIALLVQNSAMLTAILSLGATVFATRRDRLIALAIVIGFSGLDALGRLLFRGGLSDHLENWVYLQYSSTITLAFWVPQHALSGWIGAIGYLLWRDKRLPLGAWLALVPLSALWSPLGLMGTMPFVALAGIRAVLARAITLSDIVMPACTALLAIPALLYLGASAGSSGGVGMQLVAIAPVQWGLFELLEIGVYVVPLAFVARQSRFGADTLLLVALWLLFIPFVRIGWSTDFMMRGSIAALAILAVLVADAVLRHPPLRAPLAIILLIGSITGLYEIRRAFAHPPAPQLKCSLIRAWDFEGLDLGWRKPGDPPSAKGTYLAPIDAMPSLVRPRAPVRMDRPDPDRCWDGHWYHPNEALD